MTGAKPVCSAIYHLSTELFNQLQLLCRATAAACADLAASCSACCCIWAAEQPLLKKSRSGISPPVYVSGCKLKEAGKSRGQGMLVAYAAAHSIEQLL